MNILLFGDSFLGWAGGANLLGYVAKSLDKACEITGDQLIFGVSGHFLSDQSLFKHGYASVQREAIVPNQIFATFLSEARSIENIYFIVDLPRFIQQKSIDVVGPTGAVLGSLPCPWLGYIPDFQHQYLPALFSDDERSARDVGFRKIVEQAAAVYVNSRTVASDLERFYPGFFPPKKIFRFPQLYPKLVIDQRDLSLLPTKKFDIRKKYFISCSQRWIHKRHEFIVEAFRLLCERHPEFDLELIFTGSENDYRDPGYTTAVNNLIRQSGVEHRIKKLGLIDRQDQLELIRGSAALIQASIFEGGPGASGMLEAALLSTPTIATDIQPNLEFSLGRVLYFKSHDVEGLYARLLQIASEQTDDSRKGELLSANNESSQTIQITASGLNMLHELKHIISSYNK